MIEMINEISIYTMDNCRRKKELHLTAGSLNVATSPSITEYNPVPSIGRECPCGRAAAGRGDGDAFLATIVSAVPPPAAPGHHDTRQPCEGDVILQIHIVYIGVRCSIQIKIGEPLYNISQVVVVVWLSAEAAEDWVQFPLSEAEISLVQSSPRATSIPLTNTGNQVCNNQSNTWL